MENEFRVIDVVLSVILVVVMSIGIGIYFIKQASDPKELTMENYEEYLSIQIGYQSVIKGMEYSIVFTPTRRFKVTNVYMTIFVEGKSIDSQTLNVSFSATHNEPYTYKVILKSYEPSFSEIMGEVSSWYKINCSVISISGQLSRG